MNVFIYSVCFLVVFLAHSLGAKIGSVSESTKRKAMFLDREVNTAIFDFLLFEIMGSTKRRANIEENATG
jgi:hypothetical protein